MPAVIPLVVAGVSAASSAYASHKQAQASKQASDVQVNASHEAMDYQRQQQQQAMQYAERMRTLPLQGPQPGGAQSYLSQLMRVPGGGSYGAQPTAGYQFQPSMGAAASGTGAGQNLGYASLMGGQPPGGMAPNNQGGAVMMQGPDGDQRAIPQDQVAHYLSIPGFKRLGS